MKHILVIGGGFAGLWSAASAARQIEALGKGKEARITLVNPNPWHSIRVRNYEEDLTDTRVDLASILDPIGVNLTIGVVTGVDESAQNVSIEALGNKLQISYDKLILASGSHLIRPQLPGVSEYTYDVDTYDAAMKLQKHIRSLAAKPDVAGRFTVLIIGSGSTGVELACELPARIRTAAIASGDPSALKKISIILVERGPRIAKHLGGGQAVIERACSELGIEFLTNASLAKVDDQGATFNDGRRIPAATIIWCAGMQASGLTETLNAERDASGRVKVDDHMRVCGIPNIFAAGDVAHTLIDGTHPSMMSCQHARPMGRFAGHNAVNELYGMKMQSLNIDWYTTIVDLGPWGAVYTQGWDRIAVAEGIQAKNTKTIINRERIYPPRSGSRAQIFAAATIELQKPPQLNPLN